MSSEACGIKKRAFYSVFYNMLRMKASTTIFTILISSITTTIFVIIIIIIIVLGQIITVITTIEGIFSIITNRRIINIIMTIIKR